jgi:hypothetical protein
MSLLSKSFLPKTLRTVSSMKMRIRGSLVPSSCSSFPSVLLSLNNYEDVVYPTNFHEWPIKTRRLEEGSHLAQSPDIPNYRFSPSILVDVFAFFISHTQDVISRRLPRSKRLHYNPHHVNDGFLFLHYISFPSATFLLIPAHDASEYPQLHWLLLPFKKR